MKKIKILKCYRIKCPKLRIQHDAAGGTLYLCDGIVIGETGYWADEEDYPKAICDGK